MVASTAGEERDLETASGASGAGLVALEQRLEPRRTPMAGVGPGQGTERGIVGQLLDLGLIERVLELAIGRDGGNIEDRAGGG